MEEPAGSGLGKKETISAKNHSELTLIISDVDPSIFAPSLLMIPDIDHSAQVVIDVRRRSKSAIFCRGPRRAFAVNEIDQIVGCSWAKKLGVYHALSLTSLDKIGGGFQVAMLVGFGGRLLPFELQPMFGREIPIRYGVVGSGLDIVLVIVPYVVSACQVDQGTW